MRPFNKNEKDIIKKLTEIDEIKLSTLSKFLQDCYFTEERGMSFRVLNKEKLYLYYDIKKYNNEVKRRKMMAAFIELYWLIYYLIENHYIYTMGINHGEDQFITYFKCQNRTLSNAKGDYLAIKDCRIYDKDNNKVCASISCESFDIDFINKNYFGELYVTEELKEFVNDGFITKEEKQFKRSYNQTWWAIGTSIVIGLISIYLQLLFH